MTATALLIAASLAAGHPGAMDFDTDILPLFTKAGCNAGSCHGAAAGRGGFKLSLWGQDPAADYAAIVHDLEGRRVNLSRPELSLLVTKPTAGLEHGGGERLDYGGPEASRVEQWIRAGCPREGHRRLADLEVSPRSMWFARGDSPAALTVKASFSDGTVRDVADECVFTTEDPASLAVDAEGRVAPLRPGRHILLVRYIDRILPVEVGLPFDPVGDVTAPVGSGIIDSRIGERLAQLRLVPAPDCSDEAFIRRASLDLTGRLPAPESAVAFVADPSETKRERLVDALIGSEAFVQYWSWRWSVLFSIQSASLQREGAQAFHDWLEEQVRADRPWNEVVLELATAGGDSYQNGAANFCRMGANPRDMGEYLARTLLAVRLRCANCHNHPLDRWTQDDYLGLAAVFARVDRSQHVRLLPRGAVTHPATGLPAVPRIPGGSFLATDADSRIELGQWLASPQNPLVARAMVNRVWQALMGRGLVEPADDLRDTNPPSHPELLDELVQEFVNGRWSMRRLVRQIAVSRAYGRGRSEAPPVPGAEPYYAQAAVRPLAAEVFADAIADATGIRDGLPGLAPGSRAIDLFDAAQEVPSLDLLGRCSRAEPCDEGRAQAGGLAVQLHLINGPLVNATIASPDGFLPRALASGSNDDDLLDQLYWRTLCRRPTATERDWWHRQRRRSPEPEDRAALYQDLFWSLLCSKEFGTNH
jgi:hypothetical protein